MATSIPTLQEIRRSQRAEGAAAVLAIGTANPPNCVSQEEFPDYYFRVTKSQHLTDLKQKFKAMCQMTPTDKRVLVVCVELTIVSFRGPEEADAYPHTLVCQACFGDGAGAVIVGADAMHPVERPIFEMVSASQTMIPGTDRVLTMQLTEAGLDGHMFTKELVPIAAQHVNQCLTDAFQPLGVMNDGASCWNDLFFVVHPGIRSMLDHIEGALQLDSRKLAASRTVLREYGNMLGSTVIFVLDEQRRRMEVDGGTTGEWGVMMGFGPGFTIETMVLHVVAGNPHNKK